ncbi:hypothetical protein JCM10908_003106 [Rhodotorula pacifica]|uniref:RING-H2 finger protein n=1 Tax=Rhodotorula pacifica TaxID=1495444 RepID=UPI00317E62E4
MASRGSLHLTTTRYQQRSTRSCPARNGGGFARVLGAVAVALAAVHYRVPLGVEAYIPALPVNDTSALDSSNDILHLYSYNGVFNTFISRQLWAEAFDSQGNYTNITTIVPWTRYSKGVLIHFNESLRDQSPTVVPWIAMINCDTNGTSYSQVDDIFTITRDLGAQAALLYSLTSEGCQINQEYLTSFEKVLDVYATTSLQGSRIIESQFTGIRSGAYSYDSSILNASTSVIDTLLNNNALSVNGNVPTNASLDNVTSTDSIASDVFGPGSVATSSGSLPPSLFSDVSSQRGVGIYRRQQATSTPSSAVATRTSSTRTPTSSSTATPQNYLGAVMAAANMTVGGLQSATPSPSQTGNAGGGGGASTSLAMIILYAITGIVTLLFLIVIMSGAIRAARHPERYGPRAANGTDGRGGGAGRSRAEGLTRAILDTFPVVKWGDRGRGEVEGVEAGADGRRRHGMPDEEIGEEGGSIGSAEDGGRKKALHSGASTDNIELAVMPAVLGAPHHGGLDMRRESHTSTIGGGRAESFGSAGAEAPLLDLASSPRGSAALAPPVPSSTAPSSETGDHQQPPQSSAAVDAIIAATPMESDSESCPICLTEFEEGDELRILPCDERHRFHSECIDPFLLNVSRLCPLCRLDLGHVSGAHGAGEEDEEEEDLAAGGANGAHSNERREEERVIRHLRALLHRPSANSVPTTAGGATATPAGGANAEEGDSAAGMNRLRNRFAQYVDARRRDRDERRRFRRGSGSAAASSGGGAYYGAPPF